VEDPKPKKEKVRTRGIGTTVCLERFLTGAWAPTSWEKSRTAGAVFFFASIDVDARETRLIGEKAVTEASAAKAITTCNIFYYIYDGFGILKRQDTAMLVRVIVDVASCCCVCVCPSPTYF